MASGLLALESAVLGDGVALAGETVEHEGEKGSENHAGGHTTEGEKSENLSDGVFLASRRCHSQDEGDKCSEHTADDHEPVVSRRTMYHDFVAAKHVLAGLYV